jgi:cysteinyl-tRNA synthetase
LGLNLELKSSLRMSPAIGVVRVGTLVNVAGEAPLGIKRLLMQRMDARKAKNFRQADAIRDELKAKGWVIEDTPKGPRLKQAG